MKLQLESFCEFPDELLVGIRLCPSDSMIEVRYRQHSAQFCTQLQQRTQQGHGVCSAGYSDADSVSGNNEPLFPDVPEHLLNHSQILLFTDCLPSRLESAHPYHVEVVGSSSRSRALTAILNTSKMLGRSQQALMSCALGAETQPEC